MMKIRHALALTCLATLLPLGISAADDDDKRDKDRDGKDLEAIFAKLDKNDDGELKIKEFADGKRVDEKKPEAVAKLFKERDLNSNGAISLREFEKTFRDDKGNGRKGKGKKGGKAGKGMKGGKS